MERFVLGLDQGTTGTRASVMDESGKLVSHAYLTHEQHHPAPGQVEHDAEEIWRATEQVIARATQGVRPVAMGIANQGETVVLWNRKTGRPLHRAIVWQDTRTQPFMDALARDEKIACEVTDRTGLRLDAYFSASKLRWLLDHAPDARALSDRGDLCAGTLDAWLIWKLTSGRVFATDPSTAARTLLYDISERAWSDWLLTLFGIPKEILPEVRSTVGDFGVADLGGGIPIRASLADQPAALYGQGCTRAGQMKATYGTGCFIYLNTGEQHPRSDGLLTTIAWELGGKICYALDGGVFAAGSLLSWLRDDLRLVSSEQEIDEMIEDPSNTRGVVCVPALAGLGAPYFDRSARAAFFGMGLGTQRGELVRAAIAGIALRVVQIVRAMERASGNRIATLRVDGGLTRSSTIMQLQADLLGVPIEVAAESEATVLGVCQLAAERTFLTRSPARVFEPNSASPDFRARDEILANFERAIDLARKW